jgi:L-ascorbate metabolism protein UlaG (beta-lactamase superfamily)
MSEMNEKKQFLRPNVVMEALYDNWYAWSHLISPATAAMNILDRHLTIMESYLSAPQVHAQAVLNPKMRGGPFMDLGGARTEEVKSLMETTLKKAERSVALGKSIRLLDNMLSTEARGFGLEALYEKVPDVLKGYVELYYNRKNSADFRLFEPLLYKSEFYREDAQSIAFWITKNDHRPFCLSTPRLPSQDVLHLGIPFDHPAIDAMARMKRSPGDPRHIKEMLGLAAEDEPLFDSFFTDTPPPVYQKYEGDRIRMRYFGHACILIETKDVSILVDPLISYYGYHSDVEHFSEADLPDVIDFVLITHNHQDHILFETLLPLRHRIRNIIVPRTNSGKLEDPDLKLMFNTIGFRNVHGLAEMESIEIADVTVTSLPFTGEHSDLNILTKTCYLVEVAGFKLMFLADSRILEPLLYEKIQKETGDVDVLFLGMECDGAPLSWLYGPLMPKKLPRDQDATRRLSGSDCRRGMFLVDIFSPKEVYVYAMGQEPWIEFITSTKYSDDSNPIVQSDKLVAECRGRGIIAERLYGEKELLYNRKMVMKETFLV